MTDPISTYPKLTREAVKDVASVFFNTLTNPDYLSASQYHPEMRLIISTEVEKFKKYVARESRRELLLEIEAREQEKRDAEHARKLEEAEQQRIREEKDRLIAEQASKIAQQELDMQAQIAAERNRIQAEELEALKQVEVLIPAKPEPVVIPEPEDKPEPYVMSEGTSLLGEDLESRSDEYRDAFGVLQAIEKTMLKLEHLQDKGASDTVKINAINKLMDFREKHLDAIERLMNLERAQKVENLIKRFFLEVKKHPDFKKLAEKYLEILNKLD